MKEYLRVLLSWDLDKNLLGECFANAHTSFQKEENFTVVIIDRQSSLWNTEYLVMSVHVYQFCSLAAFFETLLHSFPYLVGATVRQILSETLETLRPT